VVTISDRPNERTDERTNGRSENVMPSPTLSNDESIKISRKTSDKLKINVR